MLGVGLGMRVRGSESKFHLFFVFVGSVRERAYGSRRHLVRLWLRDPEYAWETPSALQGRWDGVYAGVTPEKTVFPLEPAIRSASKGTVSGAK